MNLDKCYKEKKGDTNPSIMEAASEPAIAQLINKHRYDATKLITTYINIR